MKNVDNVGHGRKPEHGYTISSVCRPNGSGEIKHENRFESNMLCSIPLGNNVSENQSQNVK